MSILNKLFNIKPKIADSTFINPVTTEIHSHLIPNIDDGVQSLDESITVFKHFAERGYKKVITTPHIMGDFYVAFSFSTYLMICLVSFLIVRKMQLKSNW